MPTEAHRLFEALGMEVIRGSTNRYPASNIGPKPDMRYWATEIITDQIIRFGAQMLSANDGVPNEMESDLKAWRFNVSPNRREIYREILLASPHSERDARRVIAVLECK